MGRFFPSFTFRQAKGFIFKFTGGEITGEFLMSTGYLPGAHVATCPIHSKILEYRPPWAST